MYVFLYFKFILYMHGFIVQRIDLDFRSMRDIKIVIIIIDVL